MGFLKKLGKIAGSAGLEIAKGVTFVIEETSAACGINDISDIAFELRNMSSQKLADMWDKEPKEIQQATGEIVNKKLEEYRKEKEKKLSDLEKKVDKYEREHSNPDYHKISEARRYIAEEREKLY